MYNITTSSTNNDTYATATIHAAVVRMSKLIDPLQMTQEVSKEDRQECVSIYTHTYIHTYIHTYMPC